MMTVAELYQQLPELDQTARVMVWDFGAGGLVDAVLGVEPGTGVVVVQPQVAED